MAPVAELAKLGLLYFIAAFIIPKNEVRKIYVYTHAHECVYISPVPLQSTTSFGCQFIYNYIRVYTAGERTGKRMFTSYRRSYL